MKQTFITKSVLFLSIAILASCGSPSVNSNNNGNSNGDSATLVEVNVPQNFNWRTYSDVDFSFSSSQSGLMQITSTDQNVTYYAAFLNGSNTHSFKLPLPAYVKQVKATFMGQSTTLQLTDGRITHAFN